MRKTEENTLPSVTFLTNYLTHHQLPFALEMYRILGDKFIFVATNYMEEERKSMGWGSEGARYPFFHHFDDDMPYADKAINDADVLICGSTHVSYIKARLDAGKLTFRYFERLYKKGRARAFFPRGYISKWKEHTAYRKAPVYLLCAGAYVAGDFNLFASYPGKKLKWGYFPEFKEYTQEELIRPEDKKIRLLWTGRMIDWKHPEDAIELAAYLKAQGVDFLLTMVGEGTQAKDCRDRIERYHLQDHVECLGFENPESVRERMRKADIYLATSDHEEGWGAVINEAMNAGCVVFASVEMGAAPYLIRSGENGFLFNRNKASVWMEEVKDLCGDPKRRKKIGAAAYETIRDEWNAKEAAKRFVTFCEDRDRIPGKGPMSRA